MIFEHLDVFLAGCRRQQCDTVDARHDVHVEMEHHLTAGSFAELLQRNAISLERLLAGNRDLLRHADHMREIIRLDVENVAGRAFGITSVWPGDRGMMSRKARVCSSS